MPKRGATAFAIPVDASAESKASKSRLPKLIIQGILAVLLVAASAYGVTALMTGKASKEPVAVAPSLQVASSVPKSDLFVDGQFMGGLPVSVPLKAGGGAHRLQIGAAGTVYTAQIGRVSRKTWLYALVPDKKAGNKLGSVEVQSVPTGAEVRKDDGVLLGQTPIVILGQPGGVDIVTHDEGKTAQQKIKTTEQGGALQVQLGAQ